MGAVYPRGASEGRVWGCGEIKELGALGALGELGELDIAKRR